MPRHRVALDELAGERPPGRRAAGFRRDAHVPEDARYCQQPQCPDWPDGRALPSAWSCGACAERLERNAAEQRERAGRRPAP